jgi:DNA transposition AAA+ family ATPase
VTGQRFIATKEHRRFVEFANAVRRQRTIGLCFGHAGIGKTLSARRYSHWDQAVPLLETWGPRDDSDFAVYAALAKNRTVFYTPEVLTTPRQLRDGLLDITTRVDICIGEHLQHTNPAAKPHPKLEGNVELIIVDESERLTATGFEVLRGRYDRDQIGLILIGMPGLERQFSRYPQFYSRVGFAHEYRALSRDELRFVLDRHWHGLGLTLDPDDFTDNQAVAAIARITRGNFRLIERLFIQIDRVMKINDLKTITDDVVEAARSTLVIGIS